jgi:hypothetical protein
LGTNSFVNLPTVGVGYAATVLAATATELTSFTTLGPLTEGGYSNGQEAFVEQTGMLYVLRASVGVPDGVSIIVTNDDPNRQWVAWNYSIFFAAATVYFCIDAATGNDATALPSTTIAIAAANPFRTTEAARTSMGFFGNGGTAIMLVKPGDYGDVDMTNASGFQEVLWSGSTDFSRSTFDKVSVGDVPVGGTSVTGYTVSQTTLTPSAVDYTSTPIKVTATSHGLVTGDCIFGQGFNGDGTINTILDPYLNGYWTVTVIDANTFSLNSSQSVTNTFAGTSGTYIRWKLTIAGGGTPSFTPDALVGKRFRWSPTTASSTLQNTCLAIMMNATGSVIFSSPPLTTVLPSDFGFITEPGVILNNVQTAFNAPAPANTPASSGATVALQFVGLKATNWSLSGSDLTCFCESVTLFDALGISVSGLGGYECISSYTDETGNLTSNMGPGFLAESTSTVSFSTYSNILNQFFSTNPTSLVTMSQSIIGSITSGAFLGGLELQGCGTPGIGSGTTSIGSISIQGASGNNGAVRIVASTGSSALGVVGSHVSVSGCDLSNANGGTNAAIAISGIGSTLNIGGGNITGRNNSYGISFASTATTQANGAEDAFVTVSQGYGLFGNLTANYLMANGCPVSNFPFFDGSLGSFPDLIYRLQDQLNNHIGPSNGNQLNVRFIRVHTTFVNNLGSSMGRGLFARITTGGVDTNQNCTLAQANSAGNCKGLLGPCLSDTPNATPTMLSLTAEPGILKVDLTGGHVAAVPGDTFYLSQTTPGLVQTDLPGSGIIKIVGIAIGPSDTAGYTWGIVGPSMG